MPIEILELVVKADITENQVKKNASNPVQQQLSKAIDKEQLVEEIIEQVFAILDYKKQR